MDQRLKNLLVFKVYATDEELAQMLPTLAWMTLLVLIVILIGVAVCVSVSQKKDLLLPNQQNSDDSSPIL